MRSFTIACFLFVVKSACSQQADTVYYNRKWQLCERSVAEYYRCATVSLFPHKHYTGDVKDHYMNGVKQMEGTYSGTGIKEGKFSFYYPNGNLEAQGNYAKDRMYGFWNFFYPNGNKREKVYYSPEGETSFVVIDHYDSTGKMTAKDGTGSFETWVIDFHSGESYNVEGEFNNGARHGVWKFYSYTDGKYELVYEEYYENGVFRKVEFQPSSTPVSIQKASLIMMPFTAKFAESESFATQNGGIPFHSTEQIIFSPGVDSLYFNANWQICEKPFAYYYRFGTLTFDSFWFYSGIIKDYYLNGTVQMEGHYSSVGEKDGLFKFFYPDGVLQSQGNYSNDYRKGVWEFFHPDGKLHMRMNYAGDEKNFTVLDYIDSTGEVLAKDSTGYFEIKVKAASYLAPYKLEGRFKKGKRSGTWRYFNYIAYKDEDMLVMKEVYEDGVFKKGQQYISFTGRFEPYDEANNVIKLVEYDKFRITEYFAKDRNIFTHTKDDQDLEDYLFKRKGTSYNVADTSFEASFTGMLYKLNSPIILSYFNDPGKIYKGDVTINVSDSGDIEEIEVTGNLTEKEKEYMLFFFKKFKNIHELAVENVSIDAYHKIYFYTVIFSDFVPRRYLDYFPLKQFTFAFIPYDQLKEIAKESFRNRKKKNKKD